MATATKNTKTKSLNDSLVNATMATINTTVEHGEKWQALTKRLVEKSEPIRRKQMDLVFDTASAVKDQVNFGTEKMMDLVGYDQETVDRLVGYATNNPVSKKVVAVTETIKERVAENPVVKKVDATTENLKNMGTAKFNDIKEDVLEQAQKILNKGEAIVEGALSTKKAAPAAKKPAAKKATTKTAAKKTTAKAAPAAKKTAAKAKATPAPKKVEVKAEAKKEVVATPATETK